MNGVDVYILLLDVYTICGKPSCKHSRKEFKSLLRETGALEDGESIITRALKEVHKEDSAYTY